LIFRESAGQTFRHPCVRNQGKNDFWK
jgi:hypothetical protein